MISKEEVKKVANLARLTLSKKEVEKFQKELSLILDYMEKLKEVDLSKIKATSHPLEIENVLREDLSLPAKRERIKKIIDLAPETKKGYFKIKPIF